MSERNPKRNEVGTERTAVRSGRKRSGDIVERVKNERAERIKTDKNK
jgi:hypothetical protein